MDSLDRFAPATRRWFTASFAAPTPAQAGAWESVAAGEHTLVVAPTGSGKTLAGFLWSIDQLLAEPEPRGPRLRVLYVSPLKALASDIERNLRAPLAGIRAAARAAGEDLSRLRVAVRTGDTPADERRRLAVAPPDILITTPESLFLLLTSQARAALAGVRTVIVDEIHALVPNKRGTHLALSLERLDALLERPAQRLGLSATVRPVGEVARFLAGGRPVRVVDPPAEKRLELTVTVPVEDLADPGAGAGPDASPRTRSSVWPHVEEHLFELIRSHRSTIVFANSRRLAERLAARLNELAAERDPGTGTDPQPVAAAHHGSISRERRTEIEEALKAGRLPAVVATSSLELGIDMAAVDLVVQVEAPPSVASGLQRIGRSGHSVGEPSRGVILPKHRGDLLQCAVVAERMRSGAIEAVRYPRNPLDVLAQQVVAMCAVDDWRVEDIHALVRRSAPYAQLPRAALEATLDMLSGRHPGPGLEDLRARVNWDRTTGVVSGRSGSQRLAVTSGGTIPDRGLFGVYLAGEGGGRRVGELDEEMVYETRPGDAVVLGASTWLVEEITADRVLVSPAPGAHGRMPFWHGDAPGRPVELGRALGAFLRWLDGADAAAAQRRLAAAGLDERAAANLLAYVRAQRDATGALPDDRTVVIERFRDELGDWRICVHSPLGARVHAPWAQAMEGRMRDELGIEAQAIHTDDGIVLRLPEAAEVPPARLLVFDPDEVTDRVTAAVGTSALFAARFRECAARALLLPRRRPGARTPLWQQRQRAARLLQAARRHPSFPVTLEAMRECLDDVFDLPALRELMGAIARREIRVVEVDTPIPSPFASSLQFGYVAAFMYEGDAPLAERRAQALSLDRSLLAEIMGRAELRELVDAGALASLELELQRLDGRRPLRGPDDLHDALRALGPLTDAEIAARASDPGAAPRWTEELARARRALRVRVGGADRWAAAEDAGRLRDALGIPLPPGLPRAFTEPVDDPLGELVARYAATHGPFEEVEAAAALGAPLAEMVAALRRLETAGIVVAGEFRPGGRGREWVDVEVLRRLRRRSLAAFRREVEPAPPEALARLYPVWQGVEPAPRAGGERPATLDELLEVLSRLQGAPLPAAELERRILPARLPGYSPALLDELGASGELVWAGAGAEGPDGGEVVLALAERAGELLPDPQPVELSAVARAVRDALAEGGAMFFRQIAAATGSVDDRELLEALWELVWAGLVTNDTLAPLRARLSGRGPARRARRAPPLPSRLGPPAGAGRWSLLPAGRADPTVRLAGVAAQLLERHGVLTRQALTAERLPGGFAAVYPVLRAMEESGRCRRGYFVEGLGGAQFALPGAVDRMRALPDGELRAYVLAACDPANPYGAALPWPAHPTGARPARRAGATVVFVDGRLVLYVERGGRSVLRWGGSEELHAALEALVSEVRAGRAGPLAVERVDGVDVLDSPLSEALCAAGLRPTARGLKLRA